MSMFHDARRARASRNAERRERLQRARDLGPTSTKITVDADETIAVLRALGYEIDDSVLGATAEITFTFPHGNLSRIAN